jgi:hypothetical protein
MMAATWQVTGQQADQTTFTGGQPVTGHVVSFITGEGNRDSVFVPDDHYTPAKVKQLIQAQADRVDAVGRLTHQAEA